MQLHICEICKKVLDTRNETPCVINLYKESNDPDHLDLEEVCETCHDSILAHIVTLNQGMPVL